jgi:hypothetical protein
VHIEEIDALEADLPEESALKAVAARRRETANTAPVMPVAKG